MNKLISFFSLTLVLFLGACTATSTDSSATAEGPKVDAPSSASSALFTVEVLNDSLPSPRKELTTKLDGAAITINYGSPAVKGRTIWGDLEEYGKVWRTGANEATTFETSKNLSIGGQTLPAGKYALFTIPGESDWTLIFNKTHDQWGAYEYDEAQDAIRVKVVPQPGEMTEYLEFTVTEGNTIVLSWEEIMVPFEVAAAS